MVVFNHRMTTPLQDPGFGILLLVELDEGFSCSTPSFSSSANEESSARGSSGCEKLLLEAPSLNFERAALHWLLSLDSCSSSAMIYEFEGLFQAQPIKPIP